MKDKPNAAHIFCKCGHARSQHCGKSCVVVVNQSKGHVDYCKCVNFEEAKREAAQRH